MPNIHILKISLLTVGLLSFGPHAAQVGDYLIVPGERIGSVALGMQRSRVHELLQSPQQVRHYAGGLIQEAWFSLLPQQAPKTERKNARYLKRNYLCIYFKKQRVVQIEVSSPWFMTQHWLSTKAAPVSLRHWFRPYRTSHYEYQNPAPGGYPAGKHLVRYDDAIPAGIAWRYGVRGGLSPDPEPGQGPLEVTVVDALKIPLIPDPTGAVHVFQTR